MLCAVLFLALSTTASYFGSTTRHLSMPIADISGMLECGLLEIQARSPWPGFSLYPLLPCFSLSSHTQVAA